MLNNNVFIIGLGLIGGSVALAIKKEHPNCKIVGYDKDPEVMNQAKLLKVIDAEEQSIQVAAENADIIIISIPVLETEAMIEKLSNFQLKENVIITDTCSTKKSIVQKAAKFKNVEEHFIGGHPMAGSHKSGVTAAKDNLFENAFYILTPYANQTNSKMNDLKNLLKGTNAKFIELSADDHDEITGILSHFPHIIAASLVGQAHMYEEKYPLLPRLAAGGFRDITRIASSNPAMWADITLRNKDVLLGLLNEWNHGMQDIMEMIKQENHEQLLQFFSNAKAYRDMLPVHTKGIIHSFYDLYVDVPDYPGVISEITGYLAEENISITNIRILETREDIYGVLRISFQSVKDRQQAMECLKNRTSFEMFLQ
ncbi:prephenate dehydrogenase [Heyndrickxia sporothermodurans]